MTDFDLDADLQNIAELFELWADSEKLNIDDLITLRICINQIQKERNKTRSNIKQELLNKLKKMRDE